MWRHPKAWGPHRCRMRRLIRRCDDVSTGWAMRSAPLGAAKTHRSKRSQTFRIFHPFIRRCAFARSGAQRAGTKNPQNAEFFGSGEAGTGRASKRTQLAHRQVCACKTKPNFLPCRVQVPTNTGRENAGCGFPSPGRRKGQAGGQPCRIMPKIDNSRLAKRRSVLHDLGSGSGRTEVIGPVDPAIAFGSGPAGLSADRTADRFRTGSAGGAGEKDRADQPGQINRTGPNFRSLT